MRQIRFGSVCSGIEAASVAWNPLGWHAAWLAEIEPFPSAVLAHHYPNVPNLGDMTKLPERISSGEIEAPDVFCGGTPCQAFSVAGLRKSLDDARGNLSLTFCEIANAIDTVRLLRGEHPATIFWENVPGVLITKDNAFGCFLAGLAGEELPLLPPGGKWTNAGCVFGPQRAIAWRVTDAQYFGVAQRRRRVFVVASARTGFDPAAILFESDSVRRDTAPSREKGQGATHATAPCLTSSGRGVERTGDTRGQDPVVAVITMDHGQGGAEIGFDRAPTLTCNHAAPISAYATCITGDITHTLKAEGFDASEDGTGRGTPIIPVTAAAVSESGNIASTLRTGGNDHADVYNCVAIVFDTTQITSPANRSAPKAGDPCHPLAAGAHAPAIAFSAKDHGGDASEDLSPTLRAMGHTDSHANGGGQMAVAAYGFKPRIARNGRGDMGCVVGALNAQSGEAGKGDAAPCVAVTFQERGRTDGRSLEIGGDAAYALTAPNGGGRAQERNVLTPTMQVRRLTPVECERLQGFPDNYTMIPWRKKPADQCPDGPRYKALGNSWAIPNVQWIGERINAHLHALSGANTEPLPAIFSSEESSGQQSPDSTVPSIPLSVCSVTNSVKGGAA